MHISLSTTGLSYVLLLGQVEAYICWDSIHDKDVGEKLVEGNNHGEWGVEGMERFAFKSHASTS